MISLKCKLVVDLLTSLFLDGYSSLHILHLPPYPPQLKRNL